MSGHNDEILIAVAVLLMLSIGLEVLARRLNKPGLGPRCWGMLLVIVVVGVISTDLSWQLTKRRIERVLVSAAQTYALEAQQQGHENITFKTLTDDPTYLRLIEWQRRWLDANPDIADVYTLRRRPDGVWALLVDSETDYDRSGAIDVPREHRTPIGEPYVGPTAELETAAGGRAVFDDVPERDRWGEWISAYVPMRRSDGGLDAVIGVDLDSAVWSARQWEATLPPLLVSGMLLVSVTWVTLLQRARTSDQNALKQAKEAEAYTTRLLHTLIDGVPSLCVYQLDAAGNVSDWTEASQRISGFAKNEAIGLAYSSFFTVEDRALGLPESLLKRAEQFGFVRHEGWRLRRDGSRYRAEVFLNAQRDSDGVLIGFSKVAIDRTDRWIAEQQLQVRTAAIEAAADGIVISDSSLPDCPIVYASRGFMAFTGYTLDEVVGKNCRFLQGPETDARTVKAISEAIRAGESFTGEILNYRKDGTKFWNYLRVRPVRDDNGTVTRFVGVQTDITALKVAQDQLKYQHAQLLRSHALLQEQASDIETRSQELVEAIHDAEAASRSKSEFLANVSHELRTPLTAIMGYSDLLLDPSQPTSEREEWLRIVRRNASSLLELINEVLDLSKMEAGELRLDIAACDPRRIVEDVALALEPLANAKNIAMHIITHPDLPSRVRTDPTRVRQILLNLAENAVKFTDEGSVRISLSSTAGDSAETTRLLFEVQDTGIGIAPESLSHVFEPFMQADSSSTRARGGTGLGLSVSKRLAELLSGSISATSTPGEGSSFLLTLPVALATDVPEAHTAPPTAGPADTLPLSSRRILLVEDGADNRRLISHHLRKAGATVDTAEHGRIAVDMAGKRNSNPGTYDLILMDMQMPVMDGYEATRMLRAMSCSIPILAITAHAFPGDRERCLGAGCDDYLTKPIGRDDLVSACQGWIERSASRRAA